MSTITIGVDLAKSLFSACEVDGPGHVLRRQDLRREPFGRWLAQLPPGTVAKQESECTFVSIAFKSTATLTSTPH